MADKKTIGFGSRDLIIRHWMAKRGSESSEDREFLENMLALPQKPEDIERWTREALAWQEERLSAA